MMGSYTQRRHQTSCVSAWIKFALLGVVVSVLFQGASCDVEPTESQCRTHIEKALKEHHLDADEKVFEDAAPPQAQNEEEENSPTDEFTDSTEGTVTKDDDDDDHDDDDGDEDEADVKKEDDDDDGDEDGAEDSKPREQDGDEEVKTDDRDNEEAGEEENDNLEPKEGEERTRDPEDDEGKEDEGEGKKDVEEDEEKEDDDAGDKEISEEPIEIEVHEIELDADDNEDDEGAAQAKETEEGDDEGTDARDEKDEEEDDKLADEGEEDDREKDEAATDEGEEDEDKEKDETGTDEGEEDDEKEKDETGTDEREEDDDEKEKDETTDEEEEDKEVTEDEKEGNKEVTDDDQKERDDDENEPEDEDKPKEQEEGVEEEESKEEKGEETETKVEDEEVVLKREARDLGTENAAESEAEEDEGSAEEKGQEAPEEELIKEVVIPDNLRPRSHISKILKLEDSKMETILEKTIDTTLKALKGLYDNAIKPLEMLYKYRDLSNRHFGDPEIFSKPLILFMGPWSGGKSSTINYLLDNEFSHTSLRTGAEPSPAYFNILMYGEEEEILDGTQLAADWTFSGLQKFGQGLLDRLRGIKLPNKLLEKVNIVEIPGILEIRKQVQRLFPFNDACQWFIDRADIIFLVYDPSKLDVGPETEAILDQLKGREYQTRIVLNKADQVKPEELMRVQGTLIWNISPLMSSSEPPIMYSTSLWSLPYETGAPIRLLQAQERAFLRDLREAIDKRVENKIASARRFAVRVRNHAKMVDCYLTTYYNHKSIFGNRKKISDDIIEFPQKYHIYEGLSTLTNISRYDLPDPDVYRDFFKINPLYDFKKLSETCTYFRGCPINKLDVAIAYDLPELVGKYKKAVEGAKEELQKENS